MATSSNPKSAKRRRLVERSPLIEIDLPNTANPPESHTDSPKSPKPKAKKWQKVSNVTPSGEIRYALRSMKKIFPFFKLPVELRKKILIYTLVHEGDIKLISKDQQSALKCNKVTSISLHSPFSNVFLLSRHFYEEGLPIAYGMNTFQFTDILTFICFFLDKYVSPKYVKKICIEIDQSRLGKPLSGFIDLWCLLDLNYRSVIIDSHISLFRLLLKKLPKVQHLTAKVTTLSNNKVPSRKYYSSLFALFFLGQVKPRDKDRLLLEFTVPNPNFVSSPNTRTALQKAMPMEMRTSLVGTALAVMYLLRLKTFKWKDN